jgi:ubiquinone biosynthesis protein Coq4
MTIRAKLRKDAMKMAVSILQSAKDPNNLHKTHGKYLVVPDHYDLKRQAENRLLAHPLLQPLIAERFAAPWPSLDAMSDMPIGSLGFCVHARVKGLGIKELEFPPPSSDSDEDYLNNRIAITHDIHHVILGVPITVAGEAATHAYYGCTREDPFYIGTLAMWMTHGLMAPEQHRIIWEAISFGSRVGLEGPFLDACRWEEGWERPLEEWRSELGLLPLLENSPFQDEIHRWETLSS